MTIILVTLVFYALLFDKLNIFFYFIISSALHEAGHIAACLVCRKVPEIKVSVFGLKLSGYPTEKYKKLFVLISGPLVNVILILTFYFVFLKKEFTLNAYVFICVNVIILFFNILPIQLLDGGQIFQMFCSNCIIIKMFEVISEILILTTILIFSDNAVVSTVAVILFFIYVFIINNDLQ